MMAHHHQQTSFSSSIRLMGSTLRTSRISSRSLRMIIIQGTTSQGLCQSRSLKCNRISFQTTLAKKDNFVWTRISRPSSCCSILYLWTLINLTHTRASHSKSISPASRSQLMQAKKWSQMPRNCTRSAKVCFLLNKAATVRLSLSWSLIIRKDLWRSRNRAFNQKLSSTRGGWFFWKTAKLTTPLERMFRYRTRVSRSNIQTSTTKTIIRRWALSRCASVKIFSNPIS